MPNRDKIFFGIIGIITASIVFFGVYFFSKFSSGGSFADIEGDSVDISVLVKENSAIRKAADEKVILVEFGDFQCPACAFYYPVVEEVLTEYRDKLTFVFRHFPLSQHKNALPSAYAAEAAGRQGRFWEMYAVLYKNQSEWQDSKDPMAIFERYAKELGLDLEKFRDDIDEDSIADKVQADYSDGIKIGIDFTPTFYLDGVKIKNPRSVTEFKELVKRAIEE